MLDQRSWKRENWKMITKRELNWFDFEGGFSGALYMKEVDEPFCVGSDRLVICDTGLSWVQCAWKDEKIWATSMFDSNGNLMQIYFDVAKEVHLSGEDSWFVDCVIDVIYDPKGKATVIDEDELTEAWLSGTITSEEKQEAIDIAYRLKEKLEQSSEKVNEWFTQIYQNHLPYLHR